MHDGKNRRKSTVSKITAVGKLNEAWYVRAEGVGKDKHLVKRIRFQIRRFPHFQNRHLAHLG